MQEQPQARKRRLRSVVALLLAMAAGNPWRLVLIILITILGIGFIGFGGIAAWNAATQNNNSQFATGTVHHRNDADTNGAGTLTTCTDQSSPAACGVVFSLINAKPGDSVTGSVSITNTGTLPAVFALDMAAPPNDAVVSPPGSPLCGDLTMTISDAFGNYYTGPLNGMGNFPLKQAGGAFTWATGDSNTFTWFIQLPPGISDPADMGASCTVGYVWTQTNT